MHLTITTKHQRLHTHDMHMLVRNTLSLHLACQGAERIRMLPLSMHHGSTYVEHNSCTDCTATVKRTGTITVGLYRSHKFASVHTYITKAQLPHTNHTSLHMYIYYQRLLVNFVYIA